MAEVAIAIHGPYASLDHRAGPVTGLVEIDGGTSRYLIDPERDRVRLATIPGGEFDKWTSGVGLLLIARRGWWGTSLRFDGIPMPRPSLAGTTEIERPRRRPFLPRDLASCLACGRVIVAERSGGEHGFRRVTPSRRLASRASSVMAGAGAPPEVVRCRGVGGRAGRPHSLDCYGFGFSSSAFPETEGGRA